MLAYASDGQTTDVRSPEAEEDDDDGGDEVEIGVNVWLRCGDASVENERCDGGGGGGSGGCCGG